MDPGFALRKFAFASVVAVSQAAHLGSASCRKAGRLSRLPNVWRSLRDSILLDLYFGWTANGRRRLWRYADGRRLRGL